MKSILFLSILVSFLFIISLAYAALTVSPDVSKSLTENEQATVTVTVTNTAGSSTESNIVTELSSSPTWFSVVTACSSLTTLSAGASQTSTCIIKPTSTGSDLSLTATSTSQGGTSGSGSTSGINVASQSSSLTASITADSSVGTSATFYVGVTVTAPSANDVANARATISESGQCTVDTSYVPAQQTLENITKGTSKSPTNWKIASSSASGTCSITVNVVSDVGGSASPSKSITVGTASTSSSATTSTAGGDGAGGGATASKPKVLVGENEAIITIASIASSSESNFSIDSKTLAVTAMKVKVVKTVTNVQITATKLDTLPSAVVSNAPGVVSQYLDIKFNTSVAAGDVDKVTIDFKVEKSWLDANNISDSTVALYRYVNDKWNKLDTLKVSDDNTNIYYQATSPGLSIFAVAGEAKTSPSPIPVEKPAEEKKPVEKFVETVKKDMWKVVVIIVAFAAAVAGIIYFLRIKSSKPKSEFKKKRLRFLRV